jgi:hypothetical protein
MFNEKPFFTGHGTCYTTNAVLFERFPFSFSNIKVWLDAQTSQSPGSVKPNLSKKHSMGNKINYDSNMCSV